MSDELAADLAAYDADTDPSPTPDEVEATIEGWEGAFRIDNDRMAEWALRKRGAAEARIADVKATADAEHARVDAWAGATMNAPQRDVQFFDALLRDYALRQRAEGRKTVTTPHGVVKTTEGQPKAVVRDPQKLTELVRAIDPALVTVTESIPTVSALARDGIVKVTDAGVVIVESGELLPFDVVEVEPAKVNVNVVT